MICSTTCILCYCVLSYILSLNHLLLIEFVLIKYLYLYCIRIIITLLPFFIEMLQYDWLWSGHMIIKGMFHSCPGSVKSNYFTTARCHNLIVNVDYIMKAINIEKWSTGNCSQNSQHFCLLFSMEIDNLVNKKIKYLFNEYSEADLEGACGACVPPKIRKAYVMQR
jgi:hypothetical protein